MALYAIQQRTKEIGIRKVNGATAGEILYLLNRRFIGWVGIAFAIAVSYHVVFAELLAGEFRISGGHIHRNMPAVRRYRIDGYATDRKQA